MQQKTNEQFIILSGIGIILVMLGHLNWPILSFAGRMPYYSYHVMIFVFISGYFYKPKEEENILKYVKRKFCHLMIPYFIWNIFYGLISYCSHHFDPAKICIGEDPGFYNLTIAPFLSGHQFMFHAASWFVAALFLLQLCNVLGRKVLSLIKIKNETFITILYFLVGFLVVFLAKRGSVYDYYKLPGRIMLMAPIFQFGHFYKCKLENKDRLPSPLYFLLLILAQLGIYHYSHGALNYSVVWVTGFAKGIFLPFISAIIGILFWLRIARVIRDFFVKYSCHLNQKLKAFIDWIGNHSFAIMMHHLFGFFLFNRILYFLHQKGFIQNFDAELFRTDIYYNYCTALGSNLQDILFYLLYFCFGLLTAFLLDKTGKILYSTIRSKINQNN